MRSPPQPSAPPENKLFPALPLPPGISSRPSHTLQRPPWSPFQHHFKYPAGATGSRSETFPFRFSHSHQMAVAQFRFALPRPGRLTQPRRGHRQPVRSRNFGFASPPSFNVCATKARFSALRYPEKSKASHQTDMSVIIVSHNSTFVKSFFEKKSFFFTLRCCKCKISPAAG